jgi:ATP-dependent phosphoenolpyruvate carboxykinase
VDPSLSPEVVWQKVVDSVTSRYPSLEMLDAASGYMRSVYVNQKFKGPDGDYQVRTRFICSISSKTPLVYKMKIESEMSSAHQDWLPYDRVFKEDGQLIEEIQGRLGVK